MCCTGHVISNFTYSWANDAFVQVLILKMQKNQATVSSISFSTTINVDQTIFKSENIKQFRPYIFTFEKYAEKCVSKSL